MKRALQFREYRDTKPFESPGGVVSVTIDPESGMLATANCPKVRREVYIAGTQPVTSCPLHPGRGVTTVSGWDTSSAVPTPAGDGVAPPPAPRRPAVRPEPQPAQPQPSPAPPKKAEKPGVLHRLLDVLK